MKRLFLFLIFAASGIGSAWSQTATWNNTGTGDWFATGNWISGTVSSSSSTTYIDNGGTSQILSSSASASTLYVGIDGFSGSVQVQGGTLNTSNATIGDSGTVTVSGTGSSWTNQLGFTNLGSLNILNGGTVTLQGQSAASLAGTTLVSGANSRLTFAPIQPAYALATLYSGTVRIENGGAISDYGASVGNFTSFTVTGTGSSYYSTKGFSFGGTTLQVSDGATFQAVSASIGGGIGPSTVTVDGSGTTVKALGFGGLSVDSQSTFTIQNGASVQSTGGSIYQGTVNVTGTGSTWTSGGTLIFDGTLNVLSGGVVRETENMGVSIGQSTQGSVIIDGAGSTLACLNGLLVGNGTNASLVIRNGGTVTDLNGSIGYNGTGTAGVTVDGVGSLWQNREDISLGDYYSTNTLLVKNGGIAEADGGTTGSGRGSIYVQPNNSLSSIQIGDGGA
ncbi:MAG TPA: hypothetical protein VIM58_11460, partial [Candidatus Methylacidiphilales bacterium]